MFLVDTNVLLDVFTDDPQWRPWSEIALGEAIGAGPIGINPIIYAEASLAFEAVEALDRQLETLMLDRLPLPYGAAFEAARAYRRYRERRRRPIGAAAGLLHRGPRGERRLDPHHERRPTIPDVFPAVTLVSPEA